MKYIKKINTKGELNNYWATSDYKDYSIVNVTENDTLTFGLGDTFPTPFKAETIDGEVYIADSPNSVPKEERDKVIKVFYTGNVSIDLGMFHNLEEITYQRYATTNNRRIRLESPTKIKVLDLSNIRGQHKNSESRANISISDQDLLEEVILPDEWSCRMSEPTFENCPNIKKIVIGDNNNFERANGHSPLYGLKSLTTLEFKGRSKYCNKQTFDAYADRNQITINIMQGLAMNCSNLEEIKYPTNLVGIGYNAFTGTKIKIFPNVTGLKYVDVNIGEFENITIPSTVEFLAAPPFICKGNTKISVSSDNKRYREDKQTIIDTYNNSMIVGCINSEIPSNVESIYHYCFINNDIVTVHLGNIKQIDSYAFDACHKLKSIIIHTDATGSVPVLQGYAFNKCESLESIYVPIDKVNDYKAATNWNAIADKIKPMVPYTVIHDDDSKQTIDNFEEINETSMNIKSIVCGTQHTIKHCPTSLTNITISDHILTIENHAFENCTHLTEIALPNVRHIHASAFSGCSNLISVTIPQAIPPRANIGELNVNPNLKIYVPAEAIDTYKTDAEWTAFANKIFPIPEIVNNDTNNNSSNNNQ